MTNSAPDQLVLVRATIKLPGLPVGAQAWVDPSVEYIADCLAARFVVPVDQEATPKSSLDQD